MELATACVCCGSASLDRSPAVMMPFVAERVFGWRPVEITDEWGLRDVPAGITYMPCSTLRCNECGLLSVR